MTRDTRQDMASAIREAAWHDGHAGRIVATCSLCGSIGTGKAQEAAELYADGTADTIIGDKAYATVVIRAVYGAVDVDVILRGVCDGETVVDMVAMSAEWRAESEESWQAACSPAEEA